MIAGIGGYGLSLIAGMLSTLSPCVLPLLPILVGTALTAHRYGPVALASGLALSYALAGIFLATVGLAIGLDQVVFRNVTAGFLILFGLVLVSERLQERFATVTAGFSSGGQPLLERVSADSLTGQFLLGALLGIVWSPCVGPILGAAIILASQGKDLIHVSAVMALFGVGAAIPLVALGMMSHQLMLRFKSKLFATGKIGKNLLGTVLLLLGLFVVTGTDKVFEAWILTNAPEWLTNLTISI
jgi:cytochrome c biogenesis protein CcdA